MARTRKKQRMGKKTYLATEKEEESSHKKQNRRKRTKYVKYNPFIYVDTFVSANEYDVVSSADLEKKFSKSVQGRNFPAWFIVDGDKEREIARLVNVKERMYSARRKLKRKTREKEVTPDEAKPIQHEVTADIVDLVPSFELPLLLTPMSPLELDSTHFKKTDEEKPEAQPKVTLKVPVTKPQQERIAAAPIAKRNDRMLRKKQHQNLMIYVDSFDPSTKKYEIVSSTDLQRSICKSASGTDAWFVNNREIAKLHNVHERIRRARKKMQEEPLLAEAKKRMQDLQKHKFKKNKLYFSIPGSDGFHAEVPTTLMKFEDYSSSLNTVVVDGQHLKVISGKSLNERYRKQHQQKILKQLKAKDAKPEAGPEVYVVKKSKVQLPVEPTENRNVQLTAQADLKAEVKHNVDSSAWFIVDEDKEREIARLIGDKEWEIARLINIRERMFSTRNKNQLPVPKTPDEAKPAQHEQDYFTEVPSIESSLLLTSELPLDSMHFKKTDEAQPKVTFEVPLTTKPQQEKAETTLIADKSLRKRKQYQNLMIYVDSFDPLTNEYEIVSNTDLQRSICKSASGTKAWFVNDREIAKLPYVRERIRRARKKIQEEPLLAVAKKRMQDLQKQKFKTNRLYFSIPGSDGFHAEVPTTLMKFEDYSSSLNTVVVDGQHLKVISGQSLHERYRKQRQQRIMKQLKAEVKHNMVSSESVFNQRMRLSKNLSSAISLFQQLKLQCTQFITSYVWSMDDAKRGLIILYNLAKQINDSIDEYNRLSAILNLQGGTFTKVIANNTPSLPPPVLVTPSSSHEPEPLSPKTIESLAKEIEPIINPPSQIQVSHSSLAFFNADDVPLAPVPSSLDSTLLLSPMSPASTLLSTAPSISTNFHSFFNTGQDNSTGPDQSNPPKPIFKPLA